MMTQIMPWAGLYAIGDLHYLLKQNDHLPVQPRRMFRMYFVQTPFNVADLTCEEALHLQATLRRFDEIDPE